jgi:hypothetical protein
MAAPHPPLTDVTYEDFSDLEAEFTDIDKDISKPLNQLGPIGTDAPSSSSALAQVRASFPSEERDGRPDPALLGAGV